jgi:hypothetical protein
VVVFDTGLDDEVVLVTLTGVVQGAHSVETGVVVVVEVTLGTRDAVVDEVQASHS